MISFFRFLVAMLAHREYGVGALLALTVIGVGCANHAFLGADNLRDLLISASQSIIIACGLTLVMVMGEIDISMGSLTGLLAALMGLLASTEHLGWPVWAVVPAVLAAGALVGALNGLLVTVGRVPSIIATLGTLTLLAGAGELLMGGESISGLPDGLRFFAVGRVLGAPTPVAVAVVCVIATTILCRQTPLGRRIYAVGSNPQAARLAGLPAARLKVFAFAFTGLLTALAALVAVPQQGTINSGVGKQLELLVVTGVVVGGTAISGGRGTIIGSTLALLLLGMIGNVLIFLQLGPSSTYWERAIQGVFILAAVLADRLAQRRAQAGAHA